ncbi:MAG: hypothetical protein ACFB4J_08890 [Elainellaceae cyanobacterium]
MPKRFSSASIRRMTRQPVWWAAASSLGFHGLLFVLLPRLPAPPSFGDDIDARTVSVLELSSTDADRLPGFLESELPLPSVPGAPVPDDGEAIEVDPLQDLPPSLLEAYEEFFGQSGGSTAASNPYDIPTPPFGNGSSGSLGSTTSSNTSTQEREKDKPLVEEEPIESASAAAAVEGLEESEASEAETGTAEDLLDEQETSDEQTSQGDEETPGESSEDSSGQGSPPRPPQRMALSPEQEQVYEQLYAHASGQTSAGEALNTTETWLRENGISDDEMSDYLSKSLSITIDYPVDTCRIEPTADNRLDTPLVYGVVLDEAGNITNDPRLIRSSGYGVLDQEGKQAVVTRKFNAGGPGPYQVQVKFADSDSTCSVSEAIARQGVPQE